MNSLEVAWVRIRDAQDDATFWLVRWVKRRLHRAFKRDCSCQWKGADWGCGWKELGWTTDDTFAMYEPLHSESDNKAATPGAGSGMGTAVDTDPSVVARRHSLGSDDEPLR